MVMKDVCVWCVDPDPPGPIGAVYDRADGVFAIFVCDDHAEWLRTNPRFAGGRPGQFGPDFAAVFVFPQDGDEAVG